MGRHSCCLKQNLRKGLWSPEEDEKLFNYVTQYGVGCWSSVPKLAGLQRCGKSCRLRWINYLRPDLKRGTFSQQEEDLILSLHKVLGNRWAQIATQLPGRTDNEIKNFWNSYLKKKLMKQGIDPTTHKPFTREIEVVKTENLISPTETDPPLTAPPLVIRPSEPAFLLSDPIDFSLNGALFEPSPILEFHQVVSDHPASYCTSLVAYHQCLYTSTSNSISHQNIIGAELVSSDYNLASRTSRLLYDEAVNRDPCAFSMVECQTGGDLGNNRGTFSWGSSYYSKTNPSSNQLQLSEIKTEESFKPSPRSQEQSVITSHNCNALDFGDQPLASILDSLQDF